MPEIEVWIIQPMQYTGYLQYDLANKNQKFQNPLCFRPLDSKREITWCEFGNFITNVKGSG
jgi:hypothetical protein